jgi:hypothetical protein
MVITSVKALQLGPDADVLSQDAHEHAALAGALETREVAARVGTAARLVSAGHEDAVAGREAEQLALRRSPAATGAAPRGRAYESPSGCSTGIPAGTSSGSATSASGAAGASDDPPSVTATSASASTSSVSVSAGGPAT